MSPVLSASKQRELFGMSWPTWNRWRIENESIRPRVEDIVVVNQDFPGLILDHVDLSEVDLSGCRIPAIGLTESTLESCTFREADMRHAMLGHAQLRRVDMRGASLAEASLNFASFIDSDLRGTGFGGASGGSVEFLRCDLREADLSNCLLGFARFIDCQLTGANLDGAVFSSTIVSRVDLRGVDGLRGIVHRGPSTIGIDTLYSSAGDLPPELLRGAGVPEALVQAITRLFGPGVDNFHSCFISYSSKDEEFATRLHRDLQARGVRCWFAPEDLKIGSRIRASLDESIRKHEKLLLVLSQASIQSPWVEQEVETCLDRDTTEGTSLFPVMIDSTVLEVANGWPAHVRRSRHIGDFREWRQKSRMKRGWIASFVIYENSCIAAGKKVLDGA